MQEDLVSCSPQINQEIKEEIKKEIEEEIKAEVKEENSEIVPETIKTEDTTAPQESANTQKSNLTDIPVIPSENPDLNLQIDSTSIAPPVLNPVTKPTSSPMRNTVIGSSGFTFSTNPKGGIILPSNISKTPEALSALGLSYYGGKIRKKRDKKSAYNIFSKEFRKRLRDTKSSLSFLDMSKEVNCLKELIITL
jgi:hypothetical protein